MLGMSICSADEGRGASRAAGRGALGGAKRPSSAPRHFIWLPHSCARLRDAGRQSERMDGRHLRHAGAYGRLDRLGIFNNAAANPYGGPVSRTSIRGRPGTGQSYVCRNCLSGGTISGCRNFRTHGRDCYRNTDADSIGDPGVGVAASSTARGFIIALGFSTSRRFIVYLPPFAPAGWKFFSKAHS